MMNFKKLFGEWWYKYPPATEELIATLQESISHLLPKDYLDFLRWSNGGEGDPGQCHFMLWECSRTPRYNVDYLVTECFLGKLAFGDDGANMLLFDEDNRVCRTPFGDRSYDMWEVLAPDFKTFIMEIKDLD